MTTITGTNIQMLQNSDRTNSIDIDELPGYSGDAPLYQANFTPANINVNVRTTTNNRNGLPSYDEAIDVPPPPTYDSLFGKVREARKSSSGIVGFFMNVIIILLGTIGCTIIVGMTIVIPICMVVFGSIYMNECTTNPLIPVYLLVGGIFGILKQLIHLSTRVRSTREEQAEERLRQSPTQTLINCFMLGWFVIGSYWIYKEYQPNYDPKIESDYGYCNKTLYLFAFWINTSVYIFIALCSIAVCSATLAFATLLDANVTQT